MAKLHGAKVLNGLGRASAFTRNVRTAPATEQGEQGGPLLTQDGGFQECFLNICLRFCKERRDKKKKSLDIFKKTKMRMSNSFHFNHASV